jgi:hypothetical protein
MAATSRRAQAHGRGDRIAGGRNQVDGDWTVLGAEPGKGLGQEALVVDRAGDQPQMPSRRARAIRPG